MESPYKLEHIQKIKSKTYTFMLFYVNDHKMEHIVVETNDINEIVDYIKEDKTTVGNNDEKGCKYQILTLNSETEKTLGIELQKIKPFTPYFSLKVS